MLIPLLSIAFFVLLMFRYKITLSSESCEYNVEVEALIIVALDRWLIWLHNSYVEPTKWINFSKRKL